MSNSPATFSSRLESLNIREKGLICSLLNLSPLRKSMALSIRLLISSGPEWTCKACARWFGSRFIEFLVRAARVWGKAHAHRMNLLVPRSVSFKFQQKRKNRHTLRQYIHNRRENWRQREKRDSKMQQSGQLMHLSLTPHTCGPAHAKAELWGGHTGQGDMRDAVRTRQ